MNELEKPGVTAAYVNWGRWVARCSWRIRCDSAIELTGGESGFICRECLGRTEIVWPSAEKMYGIGRLLLLRPHYKNRNWLPGESLHDLVHENGLHGVLTGLPEGAEILIHNDRIVRDALPASPIKEFELGWTNWLG